MMEEDRGPDVADFRDFVFNQLGLANVLNAQSGLNVLQQLKAENPEFNPNQKTQFDNLQTLFSNGLQLETLAQELVDKFAELEQGGLIDVIGTTLTTRAAELDTRWTLVQQLVAVNKTQWPDLAVVKIWENIVKAVKLGLNDLGLALTPDQSKQKEILDKTIQRDALKRVADETKMIQGQLNDTLAEIKNSLAAAKAGDVKQLEAKVAELRAVLGPVGTVLEQIAIVRDQQLPALVASVEEIQQGITTVLINTETREPVYTIEEQTETGQVDRNGKPIFTTITKAGTLEQAVAYYSKLVGKLTTEFKKTKTKFEKLANFPQNLTDAEALNAILTRIENVSATIETNAQFEQRLVALEQSPSAATGTLVAQLVSPELDAIKLRLDTLENRTTDEALEEGVISIATDLLKKRDATIAVVQQQVGAAQSRIDGFDKKISEETSKRDEDIALLQSQVAQLFAAQSSQTSQEPKPSEPEQPSKKPKKRKTPEEISTEEEQQEKKAKKNETFVEYEFLEGYKKFRLYHDRIVESFNLEGFKPLPEYKNTTITKFIEDTITNVLKENSLWVVAIIENKLVENNITSDQRQNLEEVVDLLKEAVQLIETKGKPPSSQLRYLSYLLNILQEARVGYSTYNDPNWKRVFTSKDPIWPETVIATSAQLPEDLFDEAASALLESEDDDNDDRFLFDALAAFDL